MHRLRVDFNDVSDGLVRGLAKRVTGPGPLNVGDPIVVHDGSGEAEGTVASISDGLVRVAVDLTTWIDYEDEVGQSAGAILLNNNFWRTVAASGVVVTHGRRATGGTISSSREYRVLVGGPRDQR